MKDISPSSQMSKATQQKIYQKVDDENGNGGASSEDVSRQLMRLKKKYLNRGTQMTQQGQENLYKKRRAQVRQLEIFSQPDYNNNGREQLMCWINKTPKEGLIIGKSRFNQSQGDHGHYTKGSYYEGDTLVLISGSLENSYLLFGFELQKFE